MKNNWMAFLPTITTFLKSKKVGQQKQAYDALVEMAKLADAFEYQTEATGKALSVRILKALDQAHRMGLHKTGHALHEAARMMGYEIEQQIKTKKRKRGKREKA